MIIGFPG
ncbi:hypothetical protein LINGRAHAP2_LOCUS13921 [Linum grandiflorum]